MSEADYIPEVSAEEAEIIVPAIEAILTTMRAARAARKVDDWDWVHESIVRQALRAADHGSAAVQVRLGELVQREDHLAHGLTRFALAIALRAREAKAKASAEGFITA